MAIPSNPERFYQRGEIVIDQARRQLRIGGISVRVSSTEFNLIAYLLHKAPQIITADELAESVQGYEHISQGNANETLRYHFYRLRKKIKAATGRDDIIETVRGVGYALYEQPISNSPAGELIFMFTDIEGSTLLWEQDPQTMRKALQAHNHLIQKTLDEYGGYVFKTMGDQFCATFSSASNALSAALAIQRGLRFIQEKYASLISVRIALHSGLAEEDHGDYFGSTVNQAARILAIGHGGQVLLSGATWEKVKDHQPPEVVFRDMGLRRLKGIKNLIQVYQVIVPDLRANFPPLKSLLPQRSNLPGQVSSFVSRGKETSELAALLRARHTRLITLTGPGGVGKSRLALHVASTLLDDFQDGVFHVPLASIADGHLLPTQIARALGVAERGAQTVSDSLLNFLREKHLLLVLDNFEQILESAGLISALLQEAPHIKILVTSREALQIYGEQRYLLQPLSCPEESPAPSPATLTRFGASALFLERATSLFPDYVPDENDARMIARICKLVDGLPLAVELAAFLFQDISLAELAAQLTSRMAALTGGPRDFPARHRSLRALLDWSYHLLNAGEKALLARLSVFTGTWLVDAAEAVFVLPGKQVQATGYDLLALANKSLIQPVPNGSGETSYAMLNTIREYAAEHLEKSGETEIARQIHAEYYARMIGRAKAGLSGMGDQIEAVRLCEREHDNIRTALAWAVERNASISILQMVETLWLFWAIRSYLDEGHRWVEKALENSQTAPANLRASVLRGAGRLALFQNNFEVARKYTEESIALYEKAEDTLGLAWSLNSLGEIVDATGDPRKARKLFNESLALYKQTGNKLGSAKGLDDLGRLALWDGRYLEAEELFNESLALRRQIESTEGVALSLMALGEIQAIQGNFQKAEPYTVESLALFRQLNHATGIATSLHNLAHIARKLQNPQQAISLYLESLTLLREVSEDEKSLLVTCLLGLSAALYEAGQIEQAARMFSSLQNFELLLEMLDDGKKKDLAELKKNISSQLSSDIWEEIIVRGLGMTIDEIIGVVFE